MSVVPSVILDLMVLVKIHNAVVKLIKIGIFAIPARLSFKMARLSFIPHRVKLKMDRLIPGITNLKFFACFAPRIIRNNNFRRFYLGII